MGHCLQVFHASPKLAAVGSVDEAVVIGAALSLSSSAFVLQLLSERGELATKFGSATLGILLLQVHSSPTATHPNLPCPKSSPTPLMCTDLSQLENWLRGHAAAAAVD